MYRKATGYKYLYKTFDSFQNTLEKFNVNFRLNAFMRWNITDQEYPIQIDSPSFHINRFHQDQDLIRLLPEPSAELQQLQAEYKDINVEKVSKWHNQALDWIAMMKSWHDQDCGGSKLFLYIEDDFIICDHAAAHVLSLYQWAEMHLDHWLVIRSTFGFSGLFLQCRDIPKFVEVIIESSIKHSFPIDTALARFWDPHENLAANNPRLHYTYRHVLFDHIGVESNVGNDVMRSYTCMGLMKSAVFHFQEQFDWKCEKFMLSPCENPIIQELRITTNPILDVPLDAKNREILMNRLGFDPIVGQNNIFATCNQICKEHEKKCQPDLYQFINNCELMRSKFGNNCRCVNMNGGMNFGDPHWNVKKMTCRMLDSPRFSCEGWQWMTKRICPCKEIPDGPQTLILKSHADARERFNILMMEFYSERTRIQQERRRNQRIVEPKKILRKRIQKFVKAKQLREVEHSIGLNKPK